MTRRLFLFTAPLLAPAGDSPLYSLLERVSSALSEGDLAVFLSGFDPSLPDYERFVREAKGLLEQNNISSSVEVLKESESEAEVDWILVLKTRALAAVTTERRKVVKLKWKRHRKSARITAVDPADWFTAPRLGN